FSFHRAARSCWLGATFRRRVWKKARPITWAQAWTWPKLTKRLLLQLRLSQEQLRPRSFPRRLPQERLEDRLIIRRRLPRRLRVRRLRACPPLNPRVHPRRNCRLPEWWFSTWKREGSRCRPFSVRTCALPWKRRKTPASTSTPSAAV